MHEAVNPLCMEVRRNERAALHIYDWLGYLLPWIAKTTTNNGNEKQKHFIYSFTTKNEKENFFKLREPESTFWKKINGATMGP